MRLLKVLPCALIQVATINYFVHLTASLTVSSKNSIDGNFYFKENSEAIFICTINPYNGVLNWFYENTRVAGCIGPTNCFEVNTDGGAFKFQYDTSAGIFKLTIASIQMKYNDKIFKCHDGSSNAPFTVTVKQTSNSAVSTSIISCDCLYLSVLLSAFIMISLRMSLI